MREHALRWHQLLDHEAERLRPRGHGRNHIPRLPCRLRNLQPSFLVPAGGPMAGPADFQTHPSRPRARRGNSAAPARHRAMVGPPEELT